MFDHIGLKVKDLNAAVRFYSAALAPLDYVLCTKEASYAGLGPKGEPGLWLYAAKNAKGPGVHVALRARDQAAVDRFYKEGLKADGRDNGGPAIRADYSPNYYAAFLFDPDGNNVEAVFMK